MSEADFPMIDMDDAEAAIEKFREIAAYSPERGMDAQQINDLDNTLRRMNVTMLPPAIEFQRGRKCRCGLVDKPCGCPAGTPYYKCPPADTGDKARTRLRTLPERFVYELACSRLSVWLCRRGYRVTVSLIPWTESAASGQTRYLWKVECWDGNSDTKARVGVFGDRLTAYASACAGVASLPGNLAPKF